MPTPDQFEQFIKTTAIYGLGFVALAIGVAMVAYFAFRIGNAVVGLLRDTREKWLPQVVSGHMTFIETTKVATLRTSDAVEKLTESTTVSTNNHEKTHKALAAIARAQAECEIPEPARKHLEDAIQELK